MQPLGPVIEDPHASFDVIAALTGARRDRDRLADAMGERVDELDSLLLSQVIAATGRVGATIPVRGGLDVLCALLRMLDAALAGMVSLAELRDGLRVQSARTDGFERLGPVRVLARTAVELVERIDQNDAATRAQVGVLRGQLRDELLLQLTGDECGELDVPSQSDDSELTAFRIRDPARARRAHALVDEILHGADHHPVTGVIGTAWMRGWLAVPVLGEQVGEGDGEQVARLVDAITCHVPDAQSLLLVDVRPGPRWELVGNTLQLRDPIRAAAELPADRESIELITATRNRWCVLTTSDLRFAIVESAGYHAILGEDSFVESACGMPAISAVARFREQVELLHDNMIDPDGEDHLIAVAERFGRYRRRAR